MFKIALLANYFTIYLSFLIILSLKSPENDVKMWKYKNTGCTSWWMSQLKENVNTSGRTQNAWFIRIFSFNSDQLRSCSCPRWPPEGVLHHSQALLTTKQQPKFSDRHTDSLRLVTSLTVHIFFFVMQVVSTSYILYFYFTSFILHV